MANRFWVGGTASWDGTAGTKWATTTGGGGGAAEPTNADDVFFDGNGGSGITVTLGVNRTCKTIDFSGWAATNTLASQTFSITAGNVSFPGIVNLGANAWTWTSSGITNQILSLATNSGTGTMTFGGHTVPGRISTSIGTYTQQDDGTCTGTFTASGGSTHDLNGHTLTCLSYSVTGGSILTGTAANSKINMTDTTAAATLFTFSTGTINGSNLTLAITGATANARALSVGAANSYLMLDHSTAANSGAITLNDGAGIGTVKVVGDSSGKTIKFHGVASTTISTALNVKGIAGTQVTFSSHANGSTATLSCAAGVTINVVQCNMRDLTGTGGAEFLAVDSTNVSGNSGWIFSPPDVPFFEREVRRYIARAAVGRAGSW